VHSRVKFPYLLFLEKLRGSAVIFTFGTDISSMPADEELDFELFMPN